ncbi:MAG: hypothetical protein ACK401_01270 [Archaeoglobaceae archaeon]
MSSSNSLFKTKLSAHFVDAYIAEGEIVTLEGWLTYYDEKEKSWKPLDGEVAVYLDGVKIGSTNAKLGQFSFSFLSPSIGKHKIDLKFKAEGYESSYKSLSFEVTEKERKRSLMKFAKIVFVLILLLCLSLFSIVFLLRA